MKNIKYLNIAAFMMLTVALTSCEDYLDRAPEADVTEQDAFGNFNSFQGFTEEMYNSIMDFDKGGAWNNYSFADENLGPNPYPFDQGNYWSNSGYFHGASVNPSSLEGRDRRIWEYAWYGIRKANLALEKIDEEGLFSGTQEEKDHIKGQALFFRGWFYFEIGRYWGGMPYITRVLDPTEPLVSEEFNRLSFQEMSEAMAKDFREAADLLPNHWDESGPGQATQGHNDERINKFHALGYLGKALLYGASPMINEEATGNFSFNTALAQEAAEAFGELLSLADDTGIYQLEPWEDYMDNFHRFNSQKTGGDEGIMLPTVYNHTRIRWSAVGATVPSSFGLNSGSSADAPTHNIVKNFATVDGLPIEDDPNYDPNDPWAILEPRFEAFIIKDGDVFFSNPGDDREAQLYNGGRHRDGINPPSPTGYYSRKFNGMDGDFSVSRAGGLSAYVPYLRLADVYLMYAEAVAFGYGSPQESSTNYSMSAVDAMNTVRNRAQLPDLEAAYTANNDVFFEEIVRERAVEFFMEGLRFTDLRRWGRNDDPEYLQKTAIDFDRGSDGKPINVQERTIITRVAEDRHNWLPIPVSDTRIYEGFPQNPGW
ncbi:MAG: RagB/SusD family nutrient uptake outer membrane protein [Balneolales bacterium]